MNQKQSEIEIIDNLEFDYIPPVKNRSYLPKNPEVDTACYLEEDTDQFGDNYTAFWRVRNRDWIFVILAR